MAPRRPVDDSRGPVRKTERDRSRRVLSQNFLHDPVAVGRIVRAARLGPADLDAACRAVRLTVDTPVGYVWPEQWLTLFRLLQPVAPD